MQFEFLAKILPFHTKLRKPTTSILVCLEGENKNKEYISVFVDSEALKFDINKKYKIILQEVD